MAAKKKQAAQQPDQSAAMQPSVRTFTTWTPALIRTAEQQADRGNLKEVANLCDWLLADDRVQGTLHTRVQSLLGLDPTFEPSGDRRRSKAVVNALEAKEDWWAAYPEVELSLMVTWGILLGVAPLRHRWEEVEGHGGRVLPMPAFWHPQHIRQDQDTQKWHVKVKNSARATSSEEELVPGDGTWILHTPYGSHRPWSTALWRGLAPWVLLKHYAMTDWARHSEKSALLVATCDKDIQSSVEKRRQLADDIYDRGREAVCAMPPGFSLELVASEANAYQLYQNQIALADTAIAIQVRGGNLTTEVQSGSRAAAEAQERLGDEVKRRFDAQSVTTTIHDQSLVWWAEFNFGDGKLAPWPVYPTGPKRDLKTVAQALEKAAIAGRELTGLGLSIDAQGFIDEFELSAFVKATKPLLDFTDVKESGGKAPKTDPRTERERDTDAVQEAASAKSWLEHESGREVEPDGEVPEEGGARV